MRAVIYRRVSTGRQANHGASLEQQREACIAYAASQSWRVVGDYIEAGRSAYAEDLRRRPSFQRMIADAQGGAFDVVLVYDLSRFARRQRIQYSAAGDLESVGVRVVSVTEPMDPDTIGGFVTYSILAMQAELHSRLLSRKMKDTRAREAEHGQLSQRPPRGLVYVDGRIVWDEAAAELPRRAYALAAEGLGTPAIQARLQDEGHYISLSSLHYLLRHPAYAGMLRHQGRVLPAAWPPLIEPAVWERVQAQRAARNPRHGTRATVRTPAPAMLAGLLYCANCGAKLHYSHHAEKRHYYVCSARANGGHCDARPSRADKLDTIVSDLVTLLTLPPAAIKRARKLLEATQPPPPAPPDMDERLRRLARAYADGAFSDAEYERRRAAILATPPPSLPVAAPRVDIDAAISLLNDLPRLWSVATEAERRALLGQLVTHIYARRHEVYAIRPTALAAPMLTVIWEHRAMSHSWPPVDHIPILLTAA